MTIGINDTNLGYIDRPLLRFLIPQSFAGIFLRACTLISYSASLKANKKAAVITLWVTFGRKPL